MRGILFAWSLLVLTGCRTTADPPPHQSETAQPINAPPPVAITPSTPAPTPTTGTDAPAEPPRPAETPKPAALQCQRDADCALTRVPDEDCCPRLCAPRAVTADEARRIEARVQQCQKEGRPCALPSCRVPRFEAACVAGTCTTRRADDS